MRRPPFKLDGRHGSIRSTRTDNSKPWVMNDRVMRCWDRYAQAVLAGVAAPTGEMRLTGKPWHPVQLSLDDARAILLSRRLGGKRAVANCERIRAARERKAAERVSDDA